MAIRKEVPQASLQLNFPLLKPQNWRYLSVAANCFLSASLTSCVCFRRFLLKECASYVRAVLVVLWIMVVVGSIYQYHFHEKYKTLETCLYLIMGISPGVISLPGLNEVSGIIRVAEGGAMYILGVVFFKMDGILPFAHAIWHLFVVTGASWQFWAVVNYLYVTPSSSSELQSPPVEQLP